MSQDILSALIGGALIGLAATLLLRLNGRIAGISGILENSIFEPKDKSSLWKIIFIAGLLIGGLLLKFFAPGLLVSTLDQPFWFPVLGGLLVGFGTRLGSGCTSGHGVCGISRLSVRSIIATISFMLSGFFIVALIRHILQLGGTNV